jgi:signal transduction histidine kinase
VTSRLIPKSLAFRLLFVLGLWAAAATILTGIVTSTYLKSNAEQALNERLEEHTRRLVGALEIDGDSFKAVPDLGDPNFSIPLTGWYWAIADSQNPSEILLRSPSIENETLTVPSTASIPFDSSFQRQYTHTQNDIRSLRVETQLFLGEEGSTLYQIIVAGNRDVLDRNIDETSRSVSITLGLFGLGTILIAFFAVKIGLRPLAHAQKQLGEIREGRADSLSTDYPTEIQPLAHEINALIKTNTEVVNRARTQVGNLAHGLKTPLAVIKNERQSPTSKSWELVADQADIMDNQIRNYLDRARISAQRGSTTARTEFAPVLTRIVRVMRKLKDGIQFYFDLAEDELVFRVEEQDLEEILGNLIENASKFAKNEVAVAVVLPKTKSSSIMLADIVIEDDGPGLSDLECQRAMKRGERIDESTSGSGLGLSIVKDIATEYQGTFNLERSPSLGGLKACVSLPIVAIKPQ